MKNFLTAVLAAALLLGVGAGVSYAYLAAKDNAVNEFQVSSVDIHVEEEFDPPGDVQPGQVIKKSPRVVSSSTTDCYVRVRVHFTDSAAEQCCEPLSIGPGWEAGTDGFYYWQSALAPGGRTGALFESVKIRGDAGEIPPFDILVYAEAVQCGGLSAADAWNTMR